MYAVDFIQSSKLANSIQHDCIRDAARYRLVHASKPARKQQTAFVTKATSRLTVEQVLAGLSRIGEGLTSIPLVNYML